MIVPLPIIINMCLAPHDLQTQLETENLQTASTKLMAAFGTKITAALKQVADAKTALSSTDDKIKTAMSELVNKQVRVHG